jgi:hypothetical protein
MSNLFPIFSLLLPQLVSAGPAPELIPLEPPTRRPTTYRSSIARAKRIKVVLTVLGSMPATVYCFWKNGDATLFHNGLWAILCGIVWLIFLSYDAERFNGGDRVTDTENATHLLLAIGFNLFGIYICWQLYEDLKNSSMDLIVCHLSVAFSLQHLIPQFVSTRFFKKYFARTIYGIRVGLLIVLMFFNRCLSVLLTIIKSALFIGSSALFVFFSDLLRKLLVMIETMLFAILSFVCTVPSHIKELVVKKPKQKDPIIPTHY